MMLALARTAGLDMQRFEADLDSAETRKTVARDMQDGDRAGVEGTPRYSSMAGNTMARWTCRRSERSSKRN